MGAYILRRLLQAIPVLFGVATVTFILVRVTGDPARLLLGTRADQDTVNAIRAEWGYDKPLYVQYFRFLGNLVKLDFGRSYFSNRKVRDIILSRLPATLEITLPALIISCFLGMLIGISSAVTRGSWYDRSAMVLALVSISIPAFFLAMLVSWIFGYKLRWFPITGYASGWEGLRYMVLPIATLASRPVAVFARLTRSSLLEVMRREYILTARAKGLPERTVVFKHALRNSLIPVATVISGELAAMFSGAFFIEFIFNWPGLGQAAVSAIEKLDVPLIQGTVLFAAIVFVVINVLMDVVYTWLDPRIRLQ